MRYALSKAVEETIDVTHFILIGMRRLLQGRVSLETLSGPITIYEVAGEEGRKGTDYFIWVMALISINLGLFNLLPIPVLDGGHLLFLAAGGRAAPPAAAARARGGAYRGHDHRDQSDGRRVQERPRKALGRAARSGERALRLSTSIKQQEERRVARGDGAQRGRARRASRAQRSKRS